MSQVSVINIERNNPSIPTNFDADSGFAVPVGNNLEILGDTTPAGVIPVFTSGSGNTITTLVQFSQAVAATDATRVGLAAFNSSDFSVDANGFVTLTGLGALFFDADSGQATPNGTGNVNLLGGVGLSSIAAGNTVTFNADASIATSYQTDSGSAISVGNVLSIVGSHGINTSGATSVVTVAVNNTLTLGDLSAIAAGSPALTCTTGDVTITSGNLNMASTTSANVGVVEQNSLRFIHSYPDFRNTYVGVNAGNFTLSGTSNVGIGTNALVDCTSAAGCTCVGNSAGDSITSGGSTTAIGFGCLAALTTGTLCTAVGYQALGVNTASANSAFGYQCLFGNISGVQQSGFGHLCLSGATGSNNSAFGFVSGRFLTTGTDNCFFGNGTAGNAALTSGSFNIVVGSGSGSSLTIADSSNIIFSNTGTTGDVNTIRIGTQGTGSGQQDSCFIAGIVGVTVANAKSVTINSSTGELGVGTNSSITSWVNVTGTSDTMVAGTGYVANNAALVTLTLPASSVLGDTLKIITKGAGFCRIAQNASQTIRFAGSTTTSGVGGSLTATAIGDTLEIVSTADDEFYVVSSIGSWTVV